MAPKAVKTWTTVGTEADDTFQLQTVGVTKTTTIEQKSEQSRVNVLDLESGHEDEDDKITYDRRTRP